MTNFNGAPFKGVASARATGLKLGESPKSHAQIDSSTYRRSNSAASFALPTRMVVQSQGFARCKTNVGELLNAVCPGRGRGVGRLYPCAQRFCLQGIDLRRNHCPPLPGKRLGTEFDAAGH